jgi:hypothetical protein
MRNGGYHIYYSECNDRNELKMDTAEVFIDDKCETYVKYKDFKKCANASSTLVKNWREDIPYMLGYKRQSRKRGKLIARLQKKLHNCYFTIFELQKLCAILLQNDDNFNLCMVKTGLPTYFLMKMRNWKGLKDE